MSKVNPEIFVSLVYKNYQNVDNNPFAVAVISSSV